MDCWKGPRDLHLSNDDKVAEEVGDFFEYMGMYLIGHGRLDLCYGWCGLIVQHRFAADPSTIEDCTRYEQKGFIDWNVPRIKK